ncbi:MAG: glutamate synthase large subunit [SAR324 cluster bacterium]|nr:glutamate synthase large subunit [SAR324 cluster bacterium]
MRTGYPAKQGLYDPQFEHDSCGVGFVVDMKGRKSHDIVKKGLQLLCNLNHRGALGADPDTGDGAGLLLQIPHKFFKEQCPSLGFSLPEAGAYGIGVMFLPQNRERRHFCGGIIESLIAEEELVVLGWRNVPVDQQHVGQQASEAQPVIRQIFIGKNDDQMPQDVFERLLYGVRKQIRNSIHYEDFTIPSMSSKTIVYKGMLTPAQLGKFYPDIEHSEFESALIVAHTRFPTNTFPRWDLAQPFRYLAHNGEINTLRGNINWMTARQADLSSPLYERIQQLVPLILPRGSDSACLDNVFEFLVISGYSLAHAMMMLVPEAWEHNPDMTPKKRAFYEYHEHIMEPWDGPAALAFTDGIQIGAILDRNGLRPARYAVTKNDLVIMASEVGVLNMPPEEIVHKGRLQPGKMFLIDTNQGRIIDDRELKEEICGHLPYQQWLDEQMILLKDLPAPNQIQNSDFETLLERQKVFGYTREDVNMLLKPMVVEGTEATGSMGNDAPLAVLSDRPQVLYNYFKQIFAQVSNPAIDSIREELVMSLTSHLGKESNILKPTPQHAHLLKIEHPVLTNTELEQIKELHKEDFKTITFPILFNASDGPSGMKLAMDDLCKQAEQAARNRISLLILSDRGVDQEMVPIPALLAVAGVHHHLIRKRLRNSIGIVVETGEAREIAHFCLLIGYGAGAINPYVAFETFEQMIRDGMLPEEITFEKAIENYLKGVKKGLFKVFAKMGISTIQSYRGAQIFEAIGLNEDVIHDYFTGTPSRISGIDLEIIAQESLMRHQEAYQISPDVEKVLDSGGHYFWRRRGEHHQFNPITIQKLQEAARGDNKKAYQEFSKLVNDQNKKRATLRGLLEFKKGNPVPLDEVESADEIVKRFATGAMSLGSISQEAHETLAIAMNRIGAKSNSGEGGEDPERFHRQANGDWPISSIKQVASGRFGVTIEYLAHCNELQIKIAQGAKPGEGGQLPGQKVSPYIAKVRNSTPGVTLISPPPHHDIYSIEDLAQLIFDLKNANPKARITVKLVSEAGVGTIASGVAKAHADMIVICGHDGGTGASPQTSIKHAGVPWELGISETHQTLLLNRLRGRVRLQTDGQLKTGRDVVIAALLGAEEFGFATAPLIAIGCIMMRKCHLNTCPVGIATQNPVLRKKFTGQPEHVINYLFFIAEEAREIMAQLGFRKIDEMVGRSDMLEPQLNVDHWKARHVDVSQLLHRIEVGQGDTIFCTQKQDHGLDDQLDYQLVELAHEAIEHKKPVNITMDVHNTDRTVGAILSGKIALKYGLQGLPDNTIHCKFTGSAGQSFGAFLAHGITLELQGDANDYTGKGLSGGRLIVSKPKKASYRADENVLVGNTVLYGATAGEAFFNGLAGERFAVRNSGAITVVEGVGDHGCEYMTGGRAVILGRTGRNFAAGMSGGIAYVFDEDGLFKSHCNLAMVELEPFDDPGEQHEVRQWIEKHVEYTDSLKGQNLLADWEKTLQRFVKVMPIEYRLVLQKMKSEAA